MRKSAFICFAALLVVGCDPTGQRMLRVQLADSPTPGSYIALDSSNTQEALLILDATLTKHGFYLTASSPEPDKSGLVRTYAVKDPDWYKPFSCEVMLRAPGLLVTFGEPGFLVAPDEVSKAFVDLRFAFAEKYGKRRVSSAVRGPLPRIWLPE